MIVDPSIFRDYDIRAVAGKQLDEEGLVRVAQAIIRLFNPKRVQIGHDMRVTSPRFHQLFIETFLNSGIDVFDLGLLSTDMLFYAAGIYDEDLSITISASHNPPEYNGIKMAKKGSLPVNEISKIKDLAISSQDLEVKSDKKGTLQKRDIMQGWINHILKFIDVPKMKPFKVVSDTGNGMAGYYLPILEEKLPWKVTQLFYKLDGTFPNHVPSPIEEKNRIDCTNKVKELNADFGLVFDGDGDRVFMIDEKGRTLSGTIMTAIIAENILKNKPGATILYNAIVGRIVPEIIQKNGGKPLRVRVGYTLIKKAMRDNDADFCGEHSGHYFFKENFFADSAIIAALIVAELMSVKNKKLSEFYDEYNKYFDSGEINFTVQDKERIMKSLEQEYKPIAKSTDWLDGISVWFDNFWFNVRPSNTEPLLRLNIEANTSTILEEKVKELVLKIEKMGGKEKILKMNTNLDKMEIGKALELFPEQIKTAFDQAIKSNIPKFDFDSVVISGMGGSSNAGKIIESLISDSFKKPFVVFNDYGLPSWVNQNTLVVLNSYSGNTEETLSAYEAVKKVNAKIIGVTTGGKLAELIASGEIKGAIVKAGDTNPSGYPKSGLGLSFGALFGSLIKAGVLIFTQDDLFNSLKELEEIRKLWNVKEVAKEFEKKIPVLFSSKQLLGPLNAGRNAICEIGRTFTLFFDFPEINHVLIEATLKPDFVKEKVKYLFFESEFDHPRIKLRYKITKKIFDTQGLSYQSYMLQGKDRLTQVLEIPHYCAWLGFYLSMLEGVDPGPEPWIIELKNLLSQPVH